MAPMRHRALAAARCHVVGLPSIDPFEPPCASTVEITADVAGANIGWMRVMLRVVGLIAQRRMRHSATLGCR